ncbi:hypothetical protein IC575_002677 [Cucumis melo]
MEKEVISGKGQFICGNKHCDEKNGLASYEVVLISLDELGCSNLELFPICYKINILNDRCWLLLFVTACLFTSLLLQVNFSYFEAGENKQALVKLVTCERCSKKLHYKRKKEKEKVERKEQEMSKRKRPSDDSSDSEDEGSRTRRKGNKASTSFGDHKADNKEEFDEYLEGMFP